jgi:uncharacterized protein YbjT (DUF2867 family)
MLYEMSCNRLGEPWGAGSRDRNLDPRRACAQGLIHPALHVLHPHIDAPSPGLDAAGVPQRLIVAHGLPHTFLRALHFCGAAERAFVDFARAMAELLRG